MRAARPVVSTDDFDPFNADLFRPHPPARVRLDMALVGRYDSHAIPIGRHKYFTSCSYGQYFKRSGTVCVYCISQITVKIGGSYHTVDAFPRYSCPRAVSKEYARSGAIE